MRRERLAAVAALAWWLGCGPASQAGHQGEGQALPAASTPPAAASGSALPAASTPPATAGGSAFPLTSLAESPPAAGPAPGWSEPVEVPLDELGNGQEVKLTLPAGRTALRLSTEPPLDDDTRCFRLEQIALGSVDGPGSGPGCPGCGVSLLSRPTEGFWVLQGADTPQEATVRFSLRDCLTDEPRSAAALAKQGGPLWWRVLAPPQPHPGEATLEVRIGLTSSVLAQGGPDGGLSLWGEIIAGVRSYFAGADVRVVVSKLAELPQQNEQVTSRNGDESALAALARDAATALGPGAGVVYLPVVVVPCLVREDWLSGKDIPVSGLTPRVPGGAREGGRAEAVFLAGVCTPGDEPPEALRLARVMAHEIGHFLGLRHSDTPAGQELAEPGQVDLMHSNIVYLEGTLSWSPRQREALRLHPLLR